MTPLHSRTLLGAALAACCWLAACGGSDGNGASLPAVGTEPSTLVLRPGETDAARMTTTDLSYDMLFWPPGSDAGLPWDLPTSPDPCTPPVPGCAVLQLGAPAGGEPQPADWIRFSFTYDAYSPTLIQESWMPVVAFPASPETGAPATRMAAGGNTRGGISIAADAEGQLWFWGGPRRQVVAADARSYRAAPHRLALTGGPSTVAAVAASSSSDDDPAWLLILDGQGRAWTWGGFAPPRVGSDPVAAAYPRLVDGLDDVIAVAAGTSHALALRRDGTVWSWGSGGSGRLGHDGDGSQPLRVGGLGPVTAIAAGEAHSLALQADGSVWAWGLNARGQVGQAQVTRVPTPRRVEGIGPVDSIDAGWAYSLARRTDGTVWAWGGNDHNQLGASSGSTCPDPAPGPCSHLPLRVGQGLDGVADVAAGGAFALARRHDGSVWAWGDNLYGQLGGLPGLGTLVPIPVPGLGPVLALEAGARHALAMQSADACSVGNGRTGGRLMAWGDNVTGERGDGTAVNSLGPTPVLTLGDDDRCPALGRRLVVYRGGWQPGSLASDAADLRCTGPICWQTVADGATVTLSATATENGVQPDWRWDCAAAGHGATATLQMSAVRHCKLRFEAGDGPPPPPPPPPPSTVTLTLTVSGPGRVTSEPAGIDCGERCSAQFTAGNRVVLTPRATGDAVFVGFEGGAGCADGQPTMVTDTQCTALFQPAASGEGFLLQVQRTGPSAANGRVFAREPASGIDCGADCSERYPAGSIVFLQASVEGPDRYFSHWTGCSDLSIDDEAGILCVIVMNADHVIEADFE